MKRLSFWVGIVCYLAVMIMAPVSMFADNSVWKWMNPLPQGNTLMGVWGSSETNAFGVGASGAIVGYDGTVWSTQPSGTTQTLWGVWGSSATSVFAVGDSGAILQNDGTVWSSQPSGTNETLRSVWGSSETNVFAVGSNGTILHYNGTEWSVMESGTTESLMGIWGSSATNIFVVGYKGVILHFDGTNWSVLSSGTLENLRSVWGSSETNVFAVGMNGTILHYNGTDWSVMESGTTASLYSVWGTSATDVYAVGDGGAIRHYDGTNWSAKAGGTTMPLYGVWGSSETNVYAVGNWGTILHYGGTDWSTMTQGTMLPLHDVWGSSATDVFAVGNSGTILHYNGAVWSAMDSGMAVPFFGVWGSSATNVFAVGWNGIIQHYNGTNWSALENVTLQHLRDIWGSSATNVYAVGDSGAIVGYDGTVWSTQPSGTTQTLWGVWGSSETNVFAVGSNGTILHHDGTVWSAQPSGTTQTLWGVWGSSETNVYAVGDSGTILHYDGTNWSAQPSGTTQTLRSIWGSSETNVYAVGNWGTILQYNGTNWSAMESVTSQGLAGVWGSSGTDVFTVGLNGAILHNYWLGAMEPSVTTNAATDVTHNSATLNMSYTLGSLSSVDVSFAYKKSSDADWTHTGWTMKSVPGDHAEEITGLASDEDMDFLARVSYNSTVLEGETLQFRTNAAIPVPPAPVPMAPADNAVVAGTAIDFTWQPAAGADNYNLDVRHEADDSLFKSEEPGDVTTHTMTGFPNDGRRFRWRVRARNASGWGPWSPYRTLKNGSAPPAIGLSPNTLHFGYEIGGPPPGAQQVLITNTGEGTLEWTATANSWIDVAPAAGIGEGNTKVSVDATGLAAGTYTSQVTIEAAGATNSPQMIDVTLNVIAAGGVPAIRLSRNTLHFGYEIGGMPPGAQQVLITNTGGGTLDWTATANSWIDVAPAAGIGEGNTKVSVDATGLAAGTYTSQVTVAAAGATNSPQMIDVTLKVIAAGASAPPFGHFDTPVDGAVVSGAIPVTGWALDDVEVTRVEIKRSPHPADPPAAIGPDGLVYIGDGIFVEGARPDVEAAYPDYPLNYRAGWGYMLLTNTLPGGGNGPFTLHAVAVDPEGNWTILGKKTIAADNANSELPFGTIDTPTQGGVISGAAFQNFGWALTPQPSMIPVDGSTITIWVDGVMLGNVTYNIFRPDVAALFPGYANSNGACGLYVLDTTALANGMHTIAWRVEDDAGNVDGVGSRYFTAQNLGGGDAVGSGVRRLADLAGTVVKTAEPAYVVTGYNPRRMPEMIRPGPDGVVEIAIPEVERVEVVLGLEAMDRAVRSGRWSGRISGLTRETPPPAEIGRLSYTGYLLVGDELRPLPIGSTLDPRAGTFAWQPGPGFLGEYTFVFVRESRRGLQDKTIVRITIKPKF